MQTMRLKYFEYEDIGEFLTDKTLAKPKVLVEQEEKGFQIWLEPDYIYIRDLKINAYIGTEWIYDEDEDEYTPAIDLVIFFDSKTGEELYSEAGSAFFICVLNYCHLIDSEVSREEIGEYRWKLCEDDGYFLKEVVLGGVEVEDDSLKDDLEDAS